MKRRLLLKNTYIIYLEEYRIENIETLQNGTELLKAMRAVTYDWKADGNSDTGFIAQEMNEIILASNTFKISGFVLRELRAKGVNVFNPASTEVKNPKA